MKRSKLTWMLAAMVALLATACSNDENIPGTDGNGNGVITFTVNPDYGVKTRAGVTLPDGKALRCIMEVYDADGNAINELKQVKSIETSTDPIEFIVDKEKAKNCTAVFWADFTNTTGADQDLYYDTASGLKAVTFNTGNTTDFNGEAFYGTAAIDATGKPETTAVTLTHAIAMVTLKTTEQLKKAGSVKVTYGDTGTNNNAPKSTFNALDGTATGTAQAISKVNKVDATKTASKDTPYDFHTFYVFAPKDTKDVINMKVEMCSDDKGETPEQTTPISNVPIRANYRTNIKGDFSLAIFTISCSSDWSAGELAPLHIWDGTTPAADANYAFSGAGTSESDPYIIGCAADLAQLAANVNAGTDYAGTYFKLALDLDLDNHEWTPIGTTSGFLQADKSFKGNFNGDQHKISNLKITSNAAVHTGLFGCTDTGEISNLHVSGSITNTSDKAASGGICGLANNNIIQHCSFEGSVTVLTTGDLYSSRYAGGICGYCDGNNNTITACKNSGTITGRIAGGITGNNQHAYYYGCYNKGKISGQEVYGISHTASGATAKGCYNIGELTGSTEALPIGGGSSVSTEKCYATTNPKSDSSITIFSNSEWPSSQTGDYWYADSSNDGSENKYWISLGGWNTGGNTIEYPKLWWEK